MWMCGCVSAWSGCNPPLSGVSMYSLRMRSTSGRGCVSDITSGSVVVAAAINRGGIRTGSVGGGGGCAVLLCPPDIRTALPGRCIRTGSMGGSKGGSPGGAMGGGGGSGGSRLDEVLSSSISGLRR